MNNKGFMMAEVIVVSSVILIAMAFYYVNYNQLVSSYNRRLDYYDVRSLYELADYRNDNLPVSSSVSEIPSTYKKLSTSGTSFTNLYLVKGNQLDKLIDGESGDLNKTFIAYLDYLIRSVDFSLDNSYKYIYVSEKCNSLNNCKYAYLEVMVK